MTTDKDARIAALEAENARLSALAPAPEPADDVRERVADELARFCHEPKGVLLIMADAALSALPARVSVAEAARVKHLERALKPFNLMAGELFAQNYDAPGVVLRLDPPEGDPVILDFADFLCVRDALASAEGSEA